MAAGRRGSRRRQSRRRWRRRRCIVRESFPRGKLRPGFTSPRARCTSISGIAGWPLAPIAAGAMPGERLMARKSLPAEALLDLRRRLSAFPPRSAARRAVMQETAALYGVTEWTLYRALREHVRPKALRR